MKQHQSQHKFPVRIIEVDGICIYAGPCNGCPKSTEPFIKQFCSREEHTWYVQIDKDWAVDWFNTYGLKDMIPNPHLYDYALEVLNDVHSEDWSTFDDKKIANITVQATYLYGLVHARWICQTKGLAQMKAKYESGIFGKCPRFHCNGTNLIPMGTTLKPRRHSAKLFCPKCYDIYVTPKNIKIDGAHFGPAFPHMLLAEYTIFDKAGEFKPYIQTAFGFKIHKSRLSPFHPHSTNKHEEEIPELKFVPSE